MAVIELVEALTTAQSVVGEAERARGTRSRPRKAARGRTVEIAEDAKAESPTAASVAGSAGESQIVIEADETSDSDGADESAPYGEGSHAPLEDDSQPEGFPIKGNADSMLYHVPDSPFYDQTVPEVWFATTDAAEAAGFALPPSQRDDESTDEDGTASDAEGEDA
jgi:large subunit ribosomal protein L17